MAVTNARYAVLLEPPEVPKEGFIELCKALGTAITEHPVLAISALAITTFLLVALKMLLGHRKDVKRLEEEGRKQREMFQFVESLLSHRSDGQSKQQPRLPQKQSANRQRNRGRKS